jgi:tRNA pseudouridine38-40 synthase
VRYKLTIAYDGTAFHGWQLQPGRRTVQGVLEEAVLRLTGEERRVHASGRTDAGVHADGQVVVFDLDREWEPRRLQLALNSVTAGDVTAKAVEIVDDAFDPRRWASSRRYVYRIWNASWESPFLRRYTWRLTAPLDVDAMAAAAAHLLGEHDFTSFRAAGCDAETPVRRVFRSGIERDAECIAYTIEATAFLRHMVRNVVGTLAEVGLGKRRAEDIPALLEARDRTLAAPTAPARGLSLVEVRYDGRRR